MSSKYETVRNLAIFASGGGSNLRKIHEYENSACSYRTKLIVSNRSDSGAINYGAAMDIPCFVFNTRTGQDIAELIQVLEENEIELIALAGYLRLVPGELIRKYMNRILNIHPALLPKFGGKGMFGHYVHEAVFRAGESRSGMSIHLVNEEYDKGRIIFQASCSLPEGITPVEIAEKVLKMEHNFYPKVLDGFARNL